MRISDLSSDVCSSDLLMSAAYVFVGSAHIRHNECVPAHRTQGVSSGRDGCYIDVDGCVIQRVRPAKSCRRHRFPFVWLRPVGCDWRLASRALPQPNRWLRLYRTLTTNRRVSPASLRMSSPFVHSRPSPTPANRLRPPETGGLPSRGSAAGGSEKHTSDLQSLMR